MEIFQMQMSHAPGHTVSTEQTPGAWPHEVKLTVSLRAGWH